MNTGTRIFLSLLNKKNLISLCSLLTILPLLLFTDIYIFILLSHFIEEYLLAALLLLASLLLTLRTVRKILHSIREISRDYAGGKPVLDHFYPFIALCSGLLFFILPGLLTDLLGLLFLISPTGPFLGKVLVKTFRINLNTIYENFYISSSSNLK